MKTSDLVVGNKYLVSKHPSILHPVIFERKIPEDRIFEGEYEFDKLIFTEEEVNDYVEPVKTKVTKVKPHVKPRVKPRVKLMSNGRRQFDVNFKLTVVRHCKGLKAASGYKKGNTKGCGIKEYLSSMGIDNKHLHYWSKQFDQGHFSSERAVAFSRKDTMVHG